MKILDHCTAAMAHHTCPESIRPRTKPTYDGSTVFLRGGETTYDLDVVFDILSDRRRRIVLNHLRDADEEWVDVGDLAERIAAWEIELVDPTTVSVESIEINLVHGHLPKLDATDVIDYDEGDRRVAYRGADRVERFLDLSRREGPLP